MSNRTLTTPEELRDFCIGKNLYQERAGRTKCANQAQLMGWYKALCHDRGSRHEDSFAQVFTHPSGVNVYHDLYAGWMDVETPTDEPVRVEFSEYALNNFASRNIYEYPELVQENPFF